jgi:hypothetical protein
MEIHRLKEEFGRAPWGEPFAPLLERLLEGLSGEGVDLYGALNQLARAAALRQIRFTPDCTHDAAEYEERIYHRQEVPTRKNLHDLFNALCWIAFPLAKRAINGVHVRELAIEGTRGRGRARDAATLLDESGLILIADTPEIEALLAAARWQELFVERRLWFSRHSRPFVIGHGLCEKLLQPYKALTAHALVVTVPSEVLRAPIDLQREAADRAAAKAIPASAFAPGRLVPIPVLGLPGWWTSNDDAQFYADPAVFRRSRGRQSLLPSITSALQGGSP